MIERITAAIIVVMKITNLADISVTTASAVISLSVFKIEKIDYFHSDLDKNYDEKDIIFSRKNTLIYDVHLFCD